MLATAVDLDTRKHTHIHMHACTNQPKAGLSAHSNCVSKLKTHCWPIDSRQHDIKQELHATTTLPREAFMSGNVFLQILQAPMPYHLW